MSVLKERKMNNKLNQKMLRKKNDYICHIFHFYFIFGFIILIITIKLF